MASRCERCAHSPREATFSVILCKSLQVFFGFGVSFFQGSSYPQPFRSFEHTPGNAGCRFHFICLSLLR